MTAKPTRSADVGSGAGREHRQAVTGGVVGLILDGRGRLKDDRGRARLGALPTAESERRAKLGEWVAALKMYPRAV